MNQSIDDMQMRDAVLSVLSGQISAPFDVPFNNRDNLKIGVRAALANKGFRAPQTPTPFLGDDALGNEDASVFHRVFDALVGEGVIILENGSNRFSAELVPRPFSENWRFEGILGGGGQSRTIRVRRISDGCLGVLKIPDVETSIAVERFKREVRILQEITHAAIVRLLETNLDLAVGKLGYVTPQGIPLNQYWLNFFGKLTAQERYDRAYQILRRLVEGLGLLHIRGVVHRDLKPENVVMFGDEPVIIDFGVALRRDDDRLSVIDERVVANNFATPPAAHYGLHEGTPAWDSMGLAWIYGYLLGDGKKPKQFHWRYHQLVDEPRRERARAVLAACSHEATIPADAGEFLTLMNQFQLSGTPSEMAQLDRVRITEAEAAHAAALAQKMKDDVEQTERAEISMQVVEPTLIEIRSELNRVCVGSEMLPVACNLNETDPRKEWVNPKQPMRQILQSCYEQTRSGYHGRKTIFMCRCGPGSGYFDIVAQVYFISRDLKQDLSFRLDLKCTSSKPKGSYPHETFLFWRDGTIRQLQSHEIWTVARIGKEAFTWMTDGRLWRISMSG